MASYGCQVDWADIFIYAWRGCKVRLSLEEEFNSFVQSLGTSHVKKRKSCCSQGIQFCFWSGQIHKISLLFHSKVRNTTEFPGKIGAVYVSTSLLDQNSEYFPISLGDCCMQRSSSIRTGVVYTGTSFFQEKPCRLWFIV
eukprot:23273_5